MFCNRSYSQDLLPSEIHKTSIRRRKQMTMTAEFCTFITLMATALVFLGNTHLNTALDTIYFLKLDTSTLYPPQETELADSIMKYITDLSGAKLAHFYQVGLWNYCEGYEDKGITYCSNPTVTHYFNPIEMMISKALPAKYEPKNMAKALHNAQNASKAMFACYFLGGAFSLMSLITDWISIISSRNYLLTSVFSLISALFAIVAASTSTHLFVKFWSWLDKTPDLTVHSRLGGKMYTCVWTAAVFSWVAFALHLRVALLPASGKPGWKMATSVERRDVEAGVEEWSRKA